MDEKIKEILESENDNWSVLEKLGIDIDSIWIERAEVSASFSLFIPLLLYQIKKMLKFNSRRR